MSSEGEVSGKGSFKTDQLESLYEENSTKIRTLKLLLTLSKVVATKMSNIGRGNERSGTRLG